MKVTRIVDKSDEVFVQVRFTDPEHGEINYAKWLDPDELADYRADNKNIDAVMTKYAINAKTNYERALAAEIAANVPVSE